MQAVLRADGSEASETSVMTAQRLSRRRFGANAVTLPLASVVATACRGAARPAAGGARPGDLRPDVTVQVMTGISTQDQALFQGVVDAWQQAHVRGPQVAWTAPGGNIVQKLQALLAADTPPDLAAMNPSQVVGFADRGQLLALDPLVKRDRYDLSDFFELALSQYRWKGKLYGAARGMSNQSLYVNQSLFDQAGVPYPPTQVSATGWDFDAFLKAADGVTRRAGAEVTQYGCTAGRGLRGGWGQWVWTNGGEIFDTAFTRCLLGESKAVEALQFMQDLIHKYRVAPAPSDEAAAGGASAMFMSAGKVAMQIAPVSEIEQHRRAGFRWDYAVIPRGKGQRLTTGGGVGWEVLAATKDPEESWAVFKHVTGPAAAKQMATLWYPGRKSALDHVLKLDPDLPPHSRGVGAEGQRILHPDPIFPAWEEVQRDVISPALDVLWKNERTAAQVVEELVPKVDAALRNGS